MHGMVLAALCVVLCWLTFVCGCVATAAGWPVLPGRRPHQLWWQQQVLPCWCQQPNDRIVRLLQHWRHQLIATHWPSTLHGVLSGRGLLSLWQ